MTPDQFAHCLACWMSPGVLARACGYWQDEAEGHEIGELILTSPVLSDSSDGNFATLLQTFLDHVVIPDELVNLTRRAYGSHVSASAADWLRRFRFTGRVTFDPTGGPATAQRQVVSISSPLCELVVVGAPAGMLNELVTTNAAEWKATLGKTHASKIHHEPAGEWPFETWMDVVVAQHCGFPGLGEMGRISTSNAAENVRGHANIVGELPRSAIELSLLGLAAERSHVTVSPNKHLY